MPYSEYKSIIERMKDIERKLENAIWRDGGCEAVDEIAREIRTCTHCGHESTEVVTECPICGHRQ
jgi:rubrerythrin